MFLKRIELSGFKSFADKTIIQFDAPLTGIVGPNGCGKSNITDAVRWVLGEQSAKSLRSGAVMNDIIFAGSQSRKAVNTAKATLVFDNSEKIFDSPYEEIEITRSISRGSSEIQNFINRAPCRLKDIQDLVMDTGLGRDSLSIISQGNISSFADARPEERRLLFEEAAGVAKYKKRKKISLSKLDNVHANLERLKDLADSYQEQIDSLSVQARRAQEYIELRDSLRDVEISLLVSRVESQKQAEEKTRRTLEEKRAAQALSMQAQESLEEEIRELQQQQLTCDQQSAKAQQELSSIMEQSLSLQKQKVLMDERRRQAMESGNKEEKRQSLLALFEEARFEYEDRRMRMAAVRNDIAALEHQKAQLEVRSQRVGSTLRQANQEERRLSNALAGLDSRLAHPQGRSQGVNAVLKAQNRFSGMHGLVSSLIQCEEDYSLALSTALAGASDQIVVDTEKDARAAIAWLKQNRIGKATFLPLSVCKPRTLQPWQSDKLGRCAGILGTMDEFAQCDPRYDRLKGRLLGNILLAESLEAANDAARALNQSVKIVTLEGDVVHAGGAMTGGFHRSSQSQQAQLKAQRANVQQELESCAQAIRNMQQEQEKLAASLGSIQRQLMQKQIDREKLAGFLKLKEEKYQSLQMEIAQLDLDTQEKSDTDLVEKIAALHARQDELNSTLSLSQAQKASLLAQLSSAQEKLSALRRELSALSSSIQNQELQLARIETRLEQDLLKLGQDYSLTYEAAVSQAHPLEDLEDAAAQVKSMRRKLSAMGNVNLEAPEQLKEIQEKFDFLSGQMQELEDASRQILAAVDEMDQTMIEKFSAMFEKINESLDEVFKAMFGGGRAKLVLCDPEDMLNTGIDVDVQPPGKAVKNLATFSGGEKALIAISVLFAILKARTVPLCIFDEAEAALDQANVERFARYLTSFKDQSQFLVVTHRPGTMEQCDGLYGITMQQDGVSQVLKVLLQDARELGAQG